MEKIANKQIDSRFLHRRTIMTSDVDVFFRWKLQQVLNALQDAATGHSAELGYSMNDLREKNLCWVCLRYRLKFFDSPKLFEEISVHTWPLPLRLGIFPRLFQVENSEGKTLLRASSLWGIMDLDKRIMVNPTDYGLPHFPQTRGEDFSDLKPLQKIKEPAGLSRSVSYQTKYSDLDINGHVNNTSYLTWFDNLFSLAEHQEREIAELKIDYNLEIGPEDELDLNLYQAEKEIYFTAESPAGCHFLMLASLA